jgi:hypothetical protein
MDPPARRRPHVLVVVAQVPHEVGDLRTGDTPVMGDAGDPAERVIGFIAGGIHLADDRVFGARDVSERSHRRAHTVTATAMTDRPQHVWRAGQPQFRCVGE